MNNRNHFRTLAPRLFAAALLLVSIASALAAVRYVDVNSASNTPPYTSWATAATNIQDAVDSAVAGDEIVVTNGVYSTGGREAVGDSTPNRVSVLKPLSLRSVNGPLFTSIDGGQSNRCVYLANGASLNGFTLFNGASTRGAAGGGAYGGTLNNCVLSHNTARGTSPLGQPYGSGGGAAYSTLNNCTLTGNWVSASDIHSTGGGAYYCTLNNCTLTGNSADDGGGAKSSTLNNCTLTGNSASWGSGCASGSTLNNCIVYFNTSANGANYDSSSILNYSCTTPLPANGVGNISLDPQLASSSHLSVASPCRGAGNAAYASGMDVDGEAWASPPSIGCDEYHVGALTGPLSVAIAASFTNVAMGFMVQLTASIEGRTAASVWDFGDAIAATNQPYTSHAWTAVGDYAVVLRAYNESQPGGISATVTVHVVKDVYYVATDSPNPVAPYTSWATAATNIQDAVDAATVPGALVLVTNGIYATGGRYSRVAVDKPLSLRSINGPVFTIIDGGRSNGCVSLAKGANLFGFTLTNGFSRYGGGGANGGTLNNCTLTGNSAPEGGGGGANYCTLNNCTLSGNSASYGGGASYGTLNNCTLRGNSASGVINDGGGAFGCTLNNCTLSGNSARYGGGAESSVLNNCIVYFNTALQGGPNYDSSSILNYSCTTPQPTNGVGNITSAPLFVDLVSGNLRLQSNSPCINAGNNTYAVGLTDLNGNPRIAGGSVDMGAYEFQLPTSIAPQLTITPSGTHVILAWPTNYGGFVYEGHTYPGFTLLSTTNLVSPVVWTTVSPGPVVVNGRLVVTNSISGAQEFYTLSRPSCWPAPPGCGFVCVNGIWAKNTQCRPEF